MVKLLLWDWLKLNIKFMVRWFLSLFICYLFGLSKDRRLILLFLLWIRFLLALWILLYFLFFYLLFIFIFLTIFIVIFFIFIFIFTFYYFDLNIIMNIFHIRFNSTAFLIFRILCFMMFLNFTILNTFILINYRYLLITLFIIHSHKLILFINILFNFISFLFLFL